MAQLSDIETEYLKYICLPGLNYSLLKYYLVTPAHFKFEYDKTQNKKLLTLDDYKEMEAEKSHFVLGKAMHMLVLQPDLFSRSYVVINYDDRPNPHDDFRNAKNREWKKDKELEFETIHTGKKILSSEEVKIISGMAAAIRKSSARKLLAGSTVEMSITWVDEETGVECKATPDIDNKNKGFVADLKSMDNASPYGFRKSLNLFRYYIQLPMYSSGLQAVDGIERKTHYFICVERNPPHHVAIHELSETGHPGNNNTDSVAMGKKIFKGILSMHKKCVEDNKWPGYEIYGEYPNGVIQSHINTSELSFLENHPLLKNHA